MMNLQTGFKIILCSSLLTFAALITHTIVQAQSSSYYCHAICSFAWSPGEQNLLGAVNQYGLWLYRADDTDSEPRLFPYKHAHDLSFDPTGTTVAVAYCTDDVINTPCTGSLALFELATETWETLAQSKYPIENIKFSLDGKYVAFLAGGLNLINLTTRETIRIYAPIYTGNVLDYAIDPSSSRVAISSGFLSGHVFFGITVWSILERRIETATPFGIEASAVTFTPDGTGILFVEDDTELSHWDLESEVITSRGQLVKVKPDNINLFAFSENSAYLAASLLDNGVPDDRNLLVWESASEAQVFALDPPRGRILDSIMINPAGRYVAFGDGGDKRMLVEVWERETGTTRQLSLVP